MHPRGRLPAKGPRYRRRVGLGRWRSGGGRGVALMHKRDKARLVAAWSLCSTGGDRGRRASRGHGDARRAGDGAGNRIGHRER